MTLDRSKFIVRYYLWLVLVFQDSWAVDRRLANGTNLCSFIWRIVACTVVLLGIGLLLTGILSLLVYAVFTDPFGILVGLSVFVGIFSAAAIIVLIIGGARRLGRSENIVTTYVKAAKRGVCPLIKFGDR